MFSEKSKQMILRKLSKALDLPSSEFERILRTYIV